MLVGVVITLLVFLHLNSVTSKRDDQKPVTSISDSKPPARTSSSGTTAFSNSEDEESSEESPVKNVGEVRKPTLNVKPQIFNTWDNNIPFEYLGVLKNPQIHTTQFKNGRGSSQLVDNKQEPLKKYYDSKYNVNVMDTVQKALGKFTSHLLPKERSCYFKNRLYSHQKKDEFLPDQNIQKRVKIIEENKRSPFQKNGPLLSKNSDKNSSPLLEKHNPPMDENIRSEINLQNGIPFVSNNREDVSILRDKKRISLPVVENERRQRKAYGEENEKQPNGSEYKGARTPATLRLDIRLPSVWTKEITPLDSEIGSLQISEINNESNRNNSGHNTESVRTNPSPSLLKADVFCEELTYVDLGPPLGANVDETIRIENRIFSDGSNICKCRDREGIMINPPVIATDQPPVADTSTPDVRHTDEDSEVELPTTNKPLFVVKPYAGYPRNLGKRNTPLQRSHMFSIVSKRTPRKGENIELNDDFLSETTGQYKEISTQHYSKLSSFADVSTEEESVDNDISFHEQSISSNDNVMGQSSEPNKRIFSQLNPTPIINMEADGQEGSVTNNLKTKMVTLESQFGREYVKPSPIVTLNEETGSRDLNIGVNANIDFDKGSNILDPSLMITIEDQGSPEVNDEDDDDDEDDDNDDDDDDDDDTTDDNAQTTGNSSEFSVRDPAYEIMTRMNNMNIFNGNGGMFVGTKQSKPQEECDYDEYVEPPNGINFDDDEDDLPEENTIIEQTDRAYTTQNSLNMLERTREERQTPNLVNPSHKNRGMSNYRLQNKTEDDDWNLLNLNEQLKHNNQSNVQKLHQTNLLDKARITEQEKLDSNSIGGDVRSSETNVKLGYFARNPRYVNKSCTMNQEIVTENNNIFKGKCVTHAKPTLNSEDKTLGQQDRNYNKIAGETKNNPAPDMKYALSALLGSNYFKENSRNRYEYIADIGPSTTDMCLNIDLIMNKPDHLTDIEQKVRNSIDNSKLDLRSKIRKMDRQGKDSSMKKNIVSASPKRATSR